MVGLRRCAGFTLAELLVATAVTLVALGFAASLLHPVSVAFNTLPEAVDAQQRLRVAAQTLADDIMAAGAGPVPGGEAGPFRSWPAVLPCRWTGEPLGTRPDGCARRTPSASSRCLSPLRRPSCPKTSCGRQAPFASRRITACALSHPACRFHEGRARSWPTGRGRGTSSRSAAVSIDGLTLEHAGSALTRWYRAGALVGEAGSKAYSLRLDPGDRRSPAPPIDRRVGGHAAGRPRRGPAVRVPRPAAPPAVLEDGDPDRRRASYGPLRRPLA